MPGHPPALPCRSCHWYISYVENCYGLLPLNPGSATDRRRQPACIVAIRTIADGHPSAEIAALL